MASKIIKQESHSPYALAVSMLNPQIEKQEERLVSVKHLASLAEQLMPTAISSRKKSGNKYPTN